MIRKAEASSVLVRLPHAFKNWITEEAAKNCSSQNSEIVRCVRDRMEREQAGRAAVAFCDDRQLELFDGEKGSDS